MNKQITIKNVKYNIIKTEAVTKEHTKKFAHTSLLLQRGNGKNIYQVYILNNGTIKNVINTGAKLS